MMDINSEHYECENAWYQANGFNLCKACIEMYIKNLQPVTPQPKMGQWIRVDKDKLRCSECEIIHLIAQYPNGKINWCPNCGAKMVELQESEE